ncbi:Hypothetical_protein [Hexamita inflata]|uniref:Hypothetical_protein n=1 Tax=Hexamita inflata TaxID=28002 RepID=A0AA86NM09_9EUKA|nr:Hypothetical protein HINF_LOCUS10090 [Hexamita inflata]CAI9923445.1 Hypothetical protein HINF_LOCUS11090 [Hexamita inflata]
MHSGSISNNSSRSLTHEIFSRTSVISNVGSIYDADTEVEIDDYYQETSKQQIKESLSQMLAELAINVNNSYEEEPFIERQNFSQNAFLAEKLVEETDENYDEHLECYSRSSFEHRKVQ